MGRTGLPLTYIISIIIRVLIVVFSAPKLKRNRCGPFCIFWNGFHCLQISFHIFRASGECVLVFMRQIFLKKVASIELRQIFQKMNRSISKTKTTIIGTNGKLLKIYSSFDALKLFRSNHRNWRDDVTEKFWSVILFVHRAHFTPYQYVRCVGNRNDETQSILRRRRSIIRDRTDRSQRASIAH